MIQVVSYKRQILTPTYKQKKLSFPTTTNKQKEKDNRIKDADQRFGGFKWEIWAATTSFRRQYQARACNVRPMRKLVLSPSHSRSKNNNNTWFGAHSSEIMLSEPACSLVETLDHALITESSISASNTTYLWIRPMRYLVSLKWDNQMMSNSCSQQNSAPDTIRPTFLILHTNFWNKLHSSCSLEL